MAAGAQLQEGEPLASHSPCLTQQENGSGEGKSTGLFHFVLKLEKLCLVRILAFFVTWQVGEKAGGLLWAPGGFARAGYLRSEPLKSRSMLWVGGAPYLVVFLLLLVGQGSMGRKWHCGCPPPRTPVRCASLSTLRPDHYLTWPWPWPWNKFGRPQELPRH